MTSSNYEKEIVYKLLSVGRENGIHSKDLAYLTGLDNRYIRFIIQQLREDGKPICSSSAHGYWIASCTHDLQECLKRFTEHLNGVRSTVNALKETLERMETEENEN